MPSSVDTKIKVVVSAVVDETVREFDRLSSVFGGLKQTINAFNTEVNNGARLMTSLESTIGGLVSSFIGLKAGFPHCPDSRGLRHTFGLSICSKDCMPFPTLPRFEGIKTDCQTE